MKSSTKKHVLKHVNSITSAIVNLVLTMLCFLFSDFNYFSLLFFILSVSMSGGLNLLSRNRVDVVGGLIKDFYLFYVLLPRPP